MLTDWLGVDRDTSFSEIGGKKVKPSMDLDKGNRLVNTVAPASWRTWIYRDVSTAVWFISYNV